MGKTTLGRLAASATDSRFIAISAVLAGVKDIRQAIDEAQAELDNHGRSTVLFVDEIHRFNKAQQDALLPHVESGLLTLVGDHRASGVGGQFRTALARRSIPSNRCPATN